MSFPYRLLNVVSLVSILWMSQSMMPSQCAEEDGWEKVFGCEFDSPEDLKKWNVIKDWDNANNEKQAYVEKACTVRDGYLYLEAQKEDIMDGGKQRHYTSGKLDTKDKFDIQYGKFDIRFKVPKGKGYWPAFWLLPASGNWPPEIDWMEILCHQPEVIYVTNHYGEHKNGDHPSHGDKYTFTKPDFSEDFHTLSGIWNKDEIVCFVDGKKIATSTEGVPHEKMYLIVNLAVGGDWPGDPDETTKFPGAMVVDYIKVFKKAK